MSPPRSLSWFLQAQLLTSVVCVVSPPLSFTVLNVTRLTPTRSLSRSFIVLSNPFHTILLALLGNSVFFHDGSKFGDCARRHISNLIGKSAESDVSQREAILTSPAHDD